MSAPLPSPGTATDRRAPRPRRFQRSYAAVAAGDLERGCGCTPRTPSSRTRSARRCSTRGRGAPGTPACRAFWKLAIERSRRFRFVIHDSHANGNTCANVGTITTTFPDGGMVDTDLVMVYTVDDAGRVDLDAGVLGAGRAMATYRRGDRLLGVARPPTRPAGAARASRRGRSRAARGSARPARSRRTCPTISDLCRSSSIRGWSAA